MADKLTKKELKELRKMERMESATDPNASGGKFKYIALTLGILLFVGLFGFLVYNLKQQNSETANLPVEFSDTGWVRGSAEAENILVEFADFQCPHCKEYEPLVTQALQDFDGRLKLVFKHFPLSFPHSMISAKAAEAAGKQDKFWAMHDALFENQEQLAQSPNGREFVTNLAEELELDVEQFKSDLDNKELEKRIEDMENEGINAGVSGTPSFFVNGKRIGLSGSYDEFKKEIEEAMKKPADSAASE